MCQTALLRLPSRIHQVPNRLYEVVTESTEPVPQVHELDPTGHKECVCVRVKRYTQASQHDRARPIGCRSQYSDSNALLEKSPLHSQYSVGTQGVAFTTAVQRIDGDISPLTASHVSVASKVINEQHSVGAGTQVTVGIEDHIDSGPEISFQLAEKKHYGSREGRYPPVLIYYIRNIVLQFLGSLMKPYLVFEFLQNRLIVSVCGHVRRPKYFTRSLRSYHLRRLFLSIVLHRGLFKYFTSFYLLYENGKLFQ
ncbi:hypothetical protein FGIG_03746 [Fasciola gigantica]|uniref:Uncharacterized protein n=1 Tax=Fasciola gigantica TaxID=46835 RepID=A0A504YMX8_FASGI|nr:hypothetical protein FGIG_03746 [Fasciola gigantica]